MTKTILILGAGRSSSSLISYLLQRAGSHDWKVRIGDADPTGARARIGSAERSEIFHLDASVESSVRDEIAKADLVISMLPAFMHPQVAAYCVENGKHLITPSYVSPAMQELDAAARKNGVLLLNEMGVDPGIDHMSAMHLFDSIKAKGGELLSFESFTGGLISPGSDTNPWNYKITWNPRNVVLAGAGGMARYLENNHVRFVPYHRLFSNTVPVHIDGYGDYEGYANRDSLPYRHLYGIANIPSIYRGTLRKAGFSSAWNVLVQLGLTDDSTVMDHLGDMRWSDLTASFLPVQKGKSPKEILKNELHPDPESMRRIEWLGIFDDLPVGIAKGTPAQALQHLIERKWKLDPDDKDMIVMSHRIEYKLQEKKIQLQSTMVCEGDDSLHTAMAKTVGLPIGIAAKMLLEGKVKLRGVQLPLDKSLYTPILDELGQFKIIFTENQTALQ